MKSGHGEYLADEERIMKIRPVFFHAPHRVMFMAGATQGVLAMLWWMVDLAARSGAIPALPTWTLPPPWAHGAMLMFGCFPFFIFGFLMTAGPRWVNAEPITPFAYLSTFVFMSLGWIAFYVSLLWPPLMLPALLLTLTGWCSGLPELWRAALGGSERAHLKTTVAGLCGGALCLAAFLGFAGGGPGWLARLALTGGVWLFLLPVFVAVSHRMIPFFSSSALPNYTAVRPLWALYVLLTGFVGHALLAIAGMAQWTWLFDAPAAVIAIWLTLRWQLARSFEVRLLAVLHVAFAWLGLSLALYATQSLLLLLGIVALGLAPLHALTIGFFASMLIGMVSRVTLGHSGRALAADTWLWAMFWALQGVAVLRVAAEFIKLPGPIGLSSLAALVWLVVFISWWVKFAPAYIKPRSDGKPG